MTSSKQASPENFVPKLVPGSEIFSLPDDGVGLEFRNGDYLRFETNQRSILEAIDGESTLSEVLGNASKQDELVPIRRLVNVVQQLYWGGALENTKEEKQ